MNSEFDGGALAFIADIRAAVGDDGLRMQPDLLEYLRQMRAAARRYEWLLANARASGEHWGGRWSLVIEGPAPADVHSAHSIQIALDAAMARPT